MGGRSNAAAVNLPSREYIYSGTALLAKIDSSGTKYYHQDHLSNRMVTDSSGNTFAEMGHFPYGEKWYNATNDKLLFTTYERDAESGNDYAQARYNVSRLGRFSSPDPIAGSTSDPQSLNRYSYVRNMPVMLTDPSGMMVNCDTAKNKNGDKSTSPDSDGSGMLPNEEMDPPVPQSGCGGQKPCDYMFGGCGGADYGGLDGGFSADDSGMGTTYNVGSGDEFGLVNFAFTPTFSMDFLVAGYKNGEPWSDIVNITIYGNLDLLSLLGDPQGPSSGPDPTSFRKSLYEKLQQKINDCIKKLFGSTQVPTQTFSNSPNLDTSHTGTQLAQQGIDTSRLAPGDNSSVASRPDPSTGKYGTVSIASELYSSRPMDYLQGLYIHELGNILSYNHTGDYYKFGDPNGIGRRQDKDTGANLQNCVAPSTINF
jgi:RHS repeat-associated protein